MYGLSGLGIFFAGLGVFFIGIGYLWHVTLERDRMKAGKSDPSDDN